MGLLALDANQLAIIRMEKKQQSRLTSRHSFLYSWFNPTFRSGGSQGQQHQLWQTFNTKNATDNKKLKNVLYISRLIMPIDNQ